MEERELTQLLQQLGDRVTPGPPPLRRIVDGGEALRGRRSGRVRMIAVTAAAAALIGGGSVAAVVLDLPSVGGSSTDSAAGEAADGGGGGASIESGAGAGEDAGSGSPEAGRDTGDDEGVAAADAVDALVVSPDPVRPGDTVELTSRDEDATFGLPWRLERLSADGWTWEYWLIARQGAAQPTWAPADETVTLPALTIPPPITLVIPPAATAGEYRICQDVGTQDLCGRLTVLG